MSGRVVVITGGSAGVGRATAVRFAKEGASVAVLARGEERLEATKRELEGYGATALAHSVDVADAGAVDAVSASTPEGRKWLERLPSGEIAERNVPPDPDWTLGTWTAGCARTANAGRACMLVTHLFVRHAERADFRAGLKASVGPFVVYSK
ncbi:MAG TPA: SDR family NAD(P)-dependent oxidoreductase [Byssovorax sp.]